MNNAEQLEHPNKTIAATRRVDASRQDDLAAKLVDFQKDYPRRPSENAVRSELDQRAQRPVVLAANEVAEVRKRISVLDDASRTLEAERDILVRAIQSSRDIRIDEQREDIRRAHEIIDRAEGRIAEIKSEASEERRLCVTKYSDDLAANQRMKAAEEAKLAALERAG